MSALALATVGGLLRKSVESFGDKDALVTLSSTLSYKMLDAQSAILARGLVALGAGKGTRIALLAPDGILWITVFLAAMRIGAILVPVSTLCTASELGHILKHSDAQILIGVRRFLKHAYADRLVTAFPDLDQSRGFPLYLRQAPYLRSIWLDDPSGLPWCGSHDELLAKGISAAAPDEEILAGMEAEVVPGDEAVIIYTSGSTSQPKAVVHTQRSVSQHAQVLAAHFLIHERDRMMPLLPLFWVGGLTIALELLLSGGTLIYPDSPALEAVVDTLIKLRVNRINTWGPQLARLREAVAARGIDVETIGGLAKLRTPQGVPIPAERAANMLGMTESFGPHSSEPLDTMLPADRLGSSGRATSDYERRVVDPETGKTLGPGESGELQLRHGALMKGLYKVDPRRVFTPDGFYPTNDVVRIDADGHLFFEGRRGDMLKTAGANVSRLEIEAALRALPDVAQPIVIGLPDEKAGQVVVAAVVPKPGSAATAESLKAALGETLSSYKIPRHILLISADDVQWTPSNKVKLAEMEKMIAGRLQWPIR